VAASAATTLSSTIFASDERISADLPSAASPDSAARATESAATRTSSATSPVATATGEDAMSPETTAETNEA